MVMYASGSKNSFTIRTPSQTKKGEADTEACQYMA